MRTGAYTFNIQEFIVDWLYAHEADLQEKALVPQLHLDPFVSDIREHPDTFRRMLDAILQMLLPPQSRYTAPLPLPQRHWADFLLPPL